MPVPVECKLAYSVPVVGHVLQHEVAVELVDAIPGVDESRAKASPRQVAGEAGILNCPRINPGSKHKPWRKHNSAGLRCRRGCHLPPPQRLCPLLQELQIERLTTLPQYIVQNHIQMVNHNGTFYHLNPDLVFDVNQIGLCRVCAENPMTNNQESIAAGNDYGRLGSLKALNCTTWKACVPV